ncbi:MAG: carbohydrate-binding domain-containing protein [Oscillibacter sp.]|nr:carbohydrate-binding domain-containing protein [Oscillibacter sp.]
MKNKRIRGLWAILGAAALLSACAAAATEPGASGAESAPPAFSAPAQGTVSGDGDAPAPAQGTVSGDANGDGGAAQASVEPAATGAESAETFDFSNRDLSAAWDADSAVFIKLNGASASCDSPSVDVSGSGAVISAAGTYVLSGSLDNGSVVVDAGKEDKVQIVLNGASVRSDDFAAVYVKQADKVFVTLADGTENALSNGGSFRAVDENNADGVIFSKGDLTLNGNGKLTVDSPAKHGIVSKDDLAVAGGTYEITAAGHALSGKDGVGIADGTFAITAGKDGVHSGNDEDPQKGNVYLAGGSLAIKAADDGITASGVLQIDGGSADINALEGLEGNYIRINGGSVKIYAADDGINAAAKSGAYAPTIEINGGEIDVEVGPGDTDGIDANGNLVITGGAVNVTGNSAFDIDGTITFTGGTVTVNGQKVDAIPNQMGGGGRMGRGFGGGQDGGHTPGAGFPRGAKRGTPGANGAFDGGMKDGQRRNGTQPPDGITSPTLKTEAV